MSVPLVAPVGQVVLLRVLAVKRRLRPPVLLAARVRPVLRPLFVVGQRHKKLKDEVDTHCEATVMRPLPRLKFL